MNSEDFRRHGHEIVNWLADYYRDIAERRIVPDTAPGDLRNALPPAAPEAGESFEQVLRDFRELIVPGMVHWGHPGWFAYFPSSGSPPSALGEFLAAGLGAQCMSWSTSPAATELEQVVMSWLRQLLGLPPAFSGVIQDSASTATLLAFLTARERAGVDPARLVAYWSAEAHSSVAKAARLTGIPLQRRRVIGVDRAFAMSPSALAREMSADRERGLVPAMVVATVGTTSSTACDPIRAIGEVAREHHAWLHVDAAFGGTAAILPELRGLLDGIELADSFVTNPHKRLLTNFDCSAYFVQDVGELLQTFGTAPEYLRTRHDTESDVVNFRDWGISLGRRFRALKLWFVLRACGADGLRQMVRAQIALGHELAGWIDGEPGWERLAPAPLGLVCLRHVPPALAADNDALTAHNRAVLDRVNADGSVYLTHTTLGGCYTIRVAIGNQRTGRGDVERVWRLLRDAASALSPA